MARSVSVAELRANVTEILRAVEDQKIEVAILSEGREVARIVPAKRPMTKAEIDTWLDKVDKLAHEIGDKWPKGLTAAEAIRQDRDRL